MIRSLKRVVFFFCLGLTGRVSLVSASTWCKDDHGADVAWFFMYKLPKGVKDTHGNNYTGREYLYVDSNTSLSAQYWMLSSKNITDSMDEGALANTIAPLMKQDPTNLIYAVYNNQPPNMTDQRKYGHTKGLFMFGKETGVWLIHSVPKFPTPFAEYKYPFNEWFDKGQTVLCVTFPLAELETIAHHLHFQHPYIYENQSSLDWYAKPNLEALLNGEFYNMNKKHEKEEKHKKPPKLTAELEDVDRNKYISFATYPNYDQDMYSALVAPRLESSLSVSTWLNGPGDKLNDFLDGRYTVKDVNWLNLALSENVSIEVKNTVDHSKWAVSEDWNKPYVCVGTLNRKKPQKKRGGGTLCFKNAMLHRLLLSSVDRSFKPDTKKRKYEKAQN